METYKANYRSQMYDQLEVRIFENSVELGSQAAEDLKTILLDGIASHDVASIMLAAANSQLQFLDSLRDTKGIEWQKVRILHIDEYIGLSEDHSASFRRFIRENLTDSVHPRTFCDIRGDAQDPIKEITRYTKLLNEHPIDACILGIGENGHLAFNDPPADFTLSEAMTLVYLDEVSRRQQVGEGHFPSLNDVPEQALTVTIPSLLAPAHILVVVPEKRKALPVKSALEGPITPECPASILRKQPHARLYLDEESASLLS